MLRGDLDRTPLPDLLRELAATGATGCVYVRGRRRGGREHVGLEARSEHTGPEARVVLRGGEVSSVVLPGRVDAGSEDTAPSDPHSLGRSGTDPHLTATLLLEEALADLAVLCSWTEGSWRFRRREPSGPSLPTPLPTPLPVAELLAAVEERQAEWRELLPVVGGADAVVTLAPDPEGATHTTDGDSLELTATEYALLCAVDGSRTVRQLAAAGGHTVLDTARAVARLVSAGLVSAGFAGHEPDDTEDAAQAGAAVEDDDADASPLAAIAGIFADVLARRDEAAVPRAVPQPPSDEPVAEREISLLDVDEPAPAAADAAAERRTSAALLLSQLADEPVPAAAPARPDPPAAPHGRATGPRPLPATPARPVLTDTAALMRELSSLGIDDPAPATVTRSAASATTRERERERLASQQARKRKGIFGRG